VVVLVAGLGFVIAAVNAASRVLFAMGRERPCPDPWRGYLAARPRSSR